MRLFFVVSIPQPIELNYILTLIISFPHARRQRRRNSVTSKNFQKLETSDTSNTKGAFQLMATSLVE
jgi:hypothetical protein